MGLETLSSRWRRVWRRHEKWRAMQKRLKKWQMAAQGVLDTLGGITGDTSMLLDVFQLFMKMGTKHMLKFPRDLEKWESAMEDVGKGVCGSEGNFSLIKVKSSKDLISKL